MEIVFLLKIGAAVFVPKDIELLVAARCTTAVGVNAASAGRLVVDWLLASPLTYTPLEATMATVHKLQSQLGKTIEVRRRL